MVIAHPDSTIQCKNLSPRLGLGKGGLVDASPALAEELFSGSSSSMITMASIIGCPHPLGILLDGNLTTEFWIGAAHGKGSIYLDATHVTQLLSDQSIITVDFDMKPKIDKNNPPDLKEFSEALERLPDEIVEAAASRQGNETSAAPKKQKDAVNNKSASHITAMSTSSSMDVNVLATSLINEIAQSCTADGETQRRMRQNVIMQLNILRNSSYATGFRSGKGLK